MCFIIPLIETAKNQCQDHEHAYIVYSVYIINYNYIYINKNNIYSHLDLQALFLLIAFSGWIYAHSDFRCSLELKNAHLCLEGRVFTSF